MNPETIDCCVVSPMFSYGNGRLQPRPTELKGLMRYIYRITSTESDSRTLYQKETELFGGHMQSANGRVVLLPSPIRLQMRCDDSECRIGKKQLMLHDAKASDPNNPRIDCYLYGNLFHIDLSLIFASDGGRNPLAFYHDIFLLSLVLGGIGKRTRRGRGCMTTEDLTRIPKSQLLDWIAERLNNINIVGGNAPVYAVEHGKNSVFSRFSSEQICRPIMEEVRVGKKIEHPEEYLKRVDEASHKIKDNSFVKQQGGKFATGFAGRGTPGRFASSVIVSIVKIRDGLFPIYTMVKPMFQGEPLDKDKKERELFLQWIEEGIR